MEVEINEPKQPEVAFNLFDSRIPEGVFEDTNGDGWFLISDGQGGDVLTDEEHVYTDFSAFGENLKFVRTNKSVTFRN